MAASLKPSGESGLGLLEVMISVGILGIGVLASLILESSYLTLLKELEVRDDVEAVRAYVREAVSCEQTMASRPKACDRNQYVDVKDASGRTIIPVPSKGKASDRVGGRFSLKARCDRGNLAVAYTRYAARGGQVSVLSTSREELKDVDLFNGIPISCALFAATRPAANGATGTAAAAAAAAGGGPGSAGDGGLGAAPGGCLSAALVRVHKGRDQGSCQGQLCGISGPEFRKVAADGKASPETVYYFEVKSAGDPAQWQLRVASAMVNAGNRTSGDRAALAAGASRDLPTRSFSAPEYRISPGTYRIPFDDVFIPPSDRWKALDITTMISTRDALGAAVGNECMLVVRIMSPLVLHLASSGPFETIDLTEASVLFDLDGDGRKERTGWIPPTSAFLALDLDGNGKIDDGLELFGEGTRIGDASAANGYLALAAYDDDGNRVIDQDDPVFPRLLLWTDRNVDGISQAEELRSLASEGITRIETRYDELTDGAFGAGGSFSSNVIKFRGRYFGPTRCGTTGCDTFDVFFGTATSRSQSPWQAQLGGKLLP